MTVFRQNEKIRDKDKTSYTNIGASTTGNDIIRLKLRRQ